MRQVANDQLAPTGHFTGIGRLQSGKDAEKGRFAGAIAADEADAIVLLNAEGRAVESGPLIIANDNVGGCENAGHGVDLGERLS